MILWDLNASELTLQAYAETPTGRIKLDVVSANVRVYRVVSGVEINVLSQVPMSNISVNLWRYDWTPTSLAVGEYVIEYEMVDSTGATFLGGKDAIVRDVATQTDLAIVKTVETGRWQIVNNQMIFYDDDGTTQLLVFDLFDESGNPSMGNVFQRVKVP